MKTIYVFFANGFEVVEALTPVDVLRRAGHNVITVSVSGKKEVISSHKVTVVTDALFENFDYTDADLLILPGGQPGTDNLNAHKALKELLLKANSEGKKLAAICAAPMVLGQLGLLSGKSATCFEGMEAHLKNAKVTTDPVVVSGNIITSRGAGTAMVFSFCLVEQLDGKQKAQEVAKRMMTEWK
jgi:protein deglycase